MLCGCKDSYAVTIGRRQSLQFVLYFPHRTIRILKGRSLFSHFIPKSNGAVLGFLFEEIFEEDKRFLYEQVYHEKYNPLNFWKYTTHLLRRTAKKCPQRIRTDTDVRGYTQGRCFCWAKTRRQQLYTEVHLLAGYLHHQKALEASTAPELLITVCYFFYLSFLNGLW